MKDLAEDENGGNFPCNLKIVSGFYLLEIKRKGQLVIFLKDVSNF